DLSRWQADAIARGQARQQWGVSSDTPVIGSVARWNPLKDHHNLLAAFSQSLDSYPHMRCVLIGQGMDESNAELCGLLDRYGLRDKVILLGRRDDVPALINGLDVHVLSSRAEGFPNVVAEAMAAGVACVVTDVGDAAMMVDDAGWVAPAQDPQALSAAIDAVVSGLGSPEHVARMQQGRERVGQMFSLDAMVRNYDKVWRGVAVPGHRPADRRLL